jgi:predicted component of type VI protein secretion system
MWSKPFAKLLWKAWEMVGVCDLDREITIGRVPSCTICIDHPLVSRVHARVYPAQGGCIVEDIGSANGLLVNNRRVREQRLTHNDVIQCGALYLRYVETGPPVWCWQPSPT